MDNTKIAKVKKQRDALRKRIKEDIQKLATMGECTTFQATHMILDKLISEADSASYNFTVEEWVPNLAETYLPTTLGIVEAKHAHKAEAGVKAPGPGNYPGGWDTWMWNGYGPLTEDQYYLCKCIHEQEGTAAGSKQAKMYMDLNNAKAPFKGQSADLLIVDDLPAMPETVVLASKYSVNGITSYLGDWLNANLVKSYGVKAPEGYKLQYSPAKDAYKVIKIKKLKTTLELAQDAALEKLLAEEQALKDPTEQFTIFVPYKGALGGHYESVKVDKWYTGKQVLSAFGGLKNLPKGFVKVHHPTKDVLKVVHETGPTSWGNDDF